MKRAGKKNDGAWFRANKMIQDLETAERDALQEVLTGSPELGTLFSVIQAQMTALGVVIAGTPADYNAWAAVMLEKGIPRQIWMGKPTFTTYTRTGEPGSYTYTPDGIQEYQDCGEHIRRSVSNFLVARRQFRDVLDRGLAADGNPGGYPDAKDDPDAVE